MARKRVLLVGWDGADWQHIHPLLSAGRLPNLAQLMQSGVHGNLATLQPAISPMLWNSIVTGKHAHKHGIWGFTEPADNALGHRPFRSSSRRCEALWNILSRKGLRCGAVNWWASYPAERLEGGVVVSNQFLYLDPNRTKSNPDDVVYPAALTQPIAELVVQPEELSGSELLAFVPDGLSIDQDSDPRLGVLATHLAEMISTQAAATYAMTAIEWDFMAVYFTAIDHFCHSFMAYQPPRLPWISEADHAMYGGVLSAVYQFSDMMLHRLLAECDENTLVVLCSDHGFNSGFLRSPSVPNEPAGPALDHRQYGILCMRGPNIRTGEQLYGAGLLDIAPTILSFLDIPVASDFDGRVLQDAFVRELTTATIPTWETNERVDRHSPDVDVANESRLLSHLRALGYIETEAGSPDQVRQSTHIENRYNLARNLSFVGNPSGASNILLELVEARPWESRFLLHLIKNLLQAGNHEAAELIWSKSFSTQSRHITANLLRADIELRFGNSSAAIQHIDTVQANPGLHFEQLVHIGLVRLKLRQYPLAISALSNVLAIQPQNTEALQILSSIYLRLQQNQEAVDYALSALELQTDLPQAQLNLGIAFCRSGMIEQAISRFESCLRLRPHAWRAHRFLAWIYARQGHVELSRQHFRQSGLTVSAVDGDLHLSTAISWDRLRRLEIPSEAERDLLLQQYRPKQRPDSIRSGRRLTIVSGLPRSGTSLMMRILQAVGIEPMTDDIRQADINNPHGYFEWELVKRLHDNPAIMDAPAIEDRAVKVVSPLVHCLPYCHQYRVIYMTRNLDDIMASQLAMLARSSLNQTAPPYDSLRLELEQLDQRAQDWLLHHPRAETVIIQFEKLFAEPEEELTKLLSLFPEIEVERLREATQFIDPSLHRHKQQSPHC